MQVRDKAIINQTEKEAHFTFSLESTFKYDVHRRKTNIMLFH